MQRLDLEGGKNTDREAGDLAIAVIPSRNEEGFGKAEARGKKGRRHSGGISHIETD